jgi:hypothetical protein
MLALSNAFQPAFKVGDCVALAVDKADRGPLDPLTVCIVVLKTSDDGDFYQVGCTDGRLRTFVPKNALSFVGGTLTVNSVPDVTV